MNSEYAKLIVYVPEASAQAVREVLASQGCGKMGNYDSCSFSVKGVGRFRPLTGANPAVGSVGKVEEVAEERIETICEKSKLKQVIEAVKKIHPYEEPAIDILPLL